MATFFYIHYYREKTIKRSVYTPGFTCRRNVFLHMVIKEEYILFLYSQVKMEIYNLLLNMGTIANLFNIEQTAEVCDATTDAINT